MCTEEFIRMMFTVDLYGNRGLDSRRRSQGLPGWASPTRRAKMRKEISKV